MAKAEGVILRLQERIGKLEVDLAIALTDVDEALDKLKEASNDLENLRREREILKNASESLDKQ